MLSIPCAAQADRHAWGISSFKQREAGLQRSRHCVLLLWGPSTRAPCSKQVTCLEQICKDQKLLPHQSRPRQ